MWILKPMPFERPRNSTTSTIFQITASPPRGTRRDKGQRAGAAPRGAATVGRQTCGTPAPWPTARRRKSERAPSRTRTVTTPGILFSATARMAADLVQADPDIGEHDDDERRGVEEQDQPGLAERIGERAPPHDEPGRNPDRHRDEKRGDDARQRNRQVIRKLAARDLAPGEREHGEGIGAEAGTECAESQIAQTRKNATMEMTRRPTWPAKMLCITVPLSSGTSHFGSNQRSASPS